MPTLIVVKVTLIAISGYFATKGEQASKTRLFSSMVINGTTHLMSTPPPALPYRLFAIGFRVFIPALSVVGDKALQPLF
jgi:hypothetical protein